ncbi:Modulator of FtsH protease HflK [subsurface metagenome]
MTEQRYENNKDLQPQSPQNPAGDELDAAGKSLSEALRISFIILKIIMIVLVIVFLASGFRTVGPDEQALVLRFGKIRGVAEKRILEPGPHWVFPYPIDEIIKIPVAKKINMPVNSFWYPEMLPPGPKERIRIAEPLNPVEDGYCITRSEERTQSVSVSTGSDYSIIHSKWQLTYQIDDPERFFKNVYIEDVKPGQSYFDVITKSITPFLKAMFDDAVVTAMVHYTIDEALSSQDTIPDDVRKLLQEKLSKIESGIKVVSVELTDTIWPRQVNEAFLATHKASQERQKAVSEARTYAGNTLSEAAGLASEKIAQARAYRTKVVETARADAEYLQKLLPEYRKRPELVVQKIYLDAITHILNNADEKMIIQPTKDAKGTVLWLYFSRDPELKPKPKKEQLP